MVVMEFCKRCGSGRRDDHAEIVTRRGLRIRTCTKCHVELVQCPEPGFDHQMRTCKRRNCPRCGVNWARDWRRVMAINLAAKRGSVALVSITAPGEDRLPWDEAHCMGPQAEGGLGRLPHRHKGPAGCRVQQRAAREWADTCTWRWSRLRNAATLATRRALRNELSGELGPSPVLLERVWEPQKRGVPHLHLVLGFSTGAERAAAHAFVDELARLAPDYDFGFVDRKLEPITAEDAARYLSSYLTGRNSKKKGSIRENIANPIMPTSLVWITPALTSVLTPDSSEKWRPRLEAMRARMRITRGTGVTMRMLRKARHLWAALEGKCVAPQWAQIGDAVLVCSVFLQAFRKRPPPDDIEPALELAREVERKVRRKIAWNTFQPEIVPLAFDYANACLPVAA